MFAEHLLAVLLAIGVASGCGGSSGSVALSGAVEKGPYVLGSSISVFPIDANGNPSGQVFKTQTTTDLGEFSLSFDYTGLVAIEGNGFYYNEVSGALSHGPRHESCGKERRRILPVGNVTNQPPARAATGGMRHGEPYQEAEARG